MTHEELQRDLREAVLARTVLMPAAPSGLKRRLRAMRALLREHPLPAGVGAGVYLKDDPARTGITLGECTTVGSGRDCGLRLSCDYVSRQHCRFWRTDADWAIEDLDSTNGVYINGTRIERRALLKDGDVIQVGAATLMFVRGDRASE